MEHHMRTTELEQPDGTIRSHLRHWGWVLDGVACAALWTFYLV